MIAEAVAEDLSLVFQTPEGARVDNAVAIALKFVAVGMRRLRIAAPAQGFNGIPEPRQIHTKSLLHRRGSAANQAEFRHGLNRHAAHGARRSPQRFQ